MGAPTREEKQMLVRLFRLRLEPSLQEAQVWFSTTFQPAPWEELQAKYPFDSHEWHMLATILDYWDMLGTLIDCDLLSEDLAFDAVQGINFTWNKLKDWLPDARAENGQELWRNIEALANRQNRWRVVHVPRLQKV